MREQRVDNSHISTFVSQFLFIMSLVADCYISPRHENGFLLSISHVLGELSYIGLDGCLPMTFRLSCIVQHFWFIL